MNSVKCTVSDEDEVVHCSLRMWGVGWKRMLVMCVCFFGAGNRIRAVTRVHACRE